MNIIDNTALTEVEFKNLAQGDVFKYGDCIYMKISSIETGLGSIIGNAVRLKSGIPVIIYGTDHVIPLNHELVIK